MWLEDLLCSGDNPSVIDNKLISTPNFHSIALSLQLEAVCLSISSVATASVQRIQKMMDCNLSGLPKYLSPIGGSSAGMIPIQKTAAALLARIKHAALPLTFDPAPVSDTIEDMAPMTSMCHQGSYYKSLTCFCVKCRLTRLTKRANSYVDY